MNHRTRSRAFWVGALALLAACSGDDDDGDGDDAGGAGSANASTGGASVTGGSSPGSAGLATPAGGAPSNAGAPSAGGASGGRISGLGGTRPSLGGNPVQGGAPQTGTGGGSSSGEPTLDGLTPEELGELCSDAQASFDAAGVTETSGELTCRTAGIFAVVLFEPQTDAELQQVCQETYDECVAEPLETEDDCAEMSACAATVAEFEACVDEYPAYLERVAMEMPTCSELTMANLEQALSLDPEPTPACGTLWDKCPESGP